MSINEENSYEAYKTDHKDVKKWKEKINCYF